MESSGGGSGGGSSDSTTAPLAWHDFLDRMRQPSAAEFVKSIKSFIVSFSNKAPDPEKDSAAVQEFLANMEGAFRAHSLWAGSSEEELESAGEGLEKYVMTKLFNRAFAPLPEDAQRDEELFEKIALLQQFIRPENLDIKPAFQNETSWLLAQKELQKINMHKAPRDKLVCILNCCKVITNLLLNVSFASDGNPPGADEFLPVLIYVTIKANPPQLHSNLSYIQRYRCQSRLVSETAYFFTNILSVESFIWSIDAESISMDETEFQKQMESARAHLLGLSSNIESQTNLSNQYPKQQTSQTSGIKSDTENYPSIRDHHDIHQVHKESKDLGEDHPVTIRPSVPNLVEKGASELLKEDQLNRYFQEYPYLYANAGDLTVDDVESLLSCYKKLVLMYESLSKGMGAKISLHAPSTQPEGKFDTTKERKLDTTKDSEDATKVMSGENSEGIRRVNTSSFDNLFSGIGDTNDNIPTEESAVHPSSEKDEEFS